MLGLIAEDFEAPGLVETLFDLERRIESVVAVASGADQLARSLSGRPQLSDRLISKSKFVQESSGGLEYGVMYCWADQGTIGTVDVRSAKGRNLVDADSFTTLSSQTAPTIPEVTAGQKYYRHQQEIDQKSGAIIELQVFTSLGLPERHEVVKFDWDRTPKFGGNIQAFFGPFDTANVKYPLYFSYKMDEDGVSGSAEYGFALTPYAATLVDGDFTTSVDGQYQDIVSVAVGASGIAPEDDVYLVIRARGGAGATGTKGEIVRLQLKAPISVIENTPNVITGDLLALATQKYSTTVRFSPHGTIIHDRLTWTAGTIQYAEGIPSIFPINDNGAKNLADVDGGTAQAGTSSTITLASSFPAVDDLFNGKQIEIVSGTGSGQVRTISDYVGSTRVATVSSNWTTPPNSSSVYEIQTIIYIFFDPDVDVNDLQFSLEFQDVLEIDGARKSPKRLFIGEVERGKDSDEYLWIITSTGPPILSAPLIFFGRLKGLLAQIKVLELEDVLTVSAGGKITDAGGNFVIDDAGFKVEAASVYNDINSFSIFEGGTERFRLWHDTLNNKTNIVGDEAIAFGTSNGLLLLTSGGNALKIGDPSLAPAITIEGGTVLIQTIGVGGADITIKTLGTGDDINIDPATGGKVLIGGTGDMGVQGDLEIDGDLNHDGSKTGFHGTIPASIQTITGSRGSNAALTSLLSALGNGGIGLINDTTT